MKPFASELFMVFESATGLEVVAQGLVVLQVELGVQVGLNFLDFSEELVDTEAIHISLNLVIVR